MLLSGGSQEALHGTETLGSRLLHPADPPRQMWGKDIPTGLKPSSLSPPHHRHQCTFSLPPVHQALGLHCVWRTLLPTRTQRCTNPLKIQPLFKSHLPQKNPPPPTHTSLPPSAVCPSLCLCHPEESLFLPTVQPTICQHLLCPLPHLWTCPDKGDLLLPRDLDLFRSPLLRPCGIWHSWPRCFLPELSLPWLSSYFITALAPSSFGASRFPPRVLFFPLPLNCECFLGPLLGCLSTPHPPSRDRLPAPVNSSFPQMLMSQVLSQPRCWLLLCSDLCSLSCSMFLVECPMDALRWFLRRNHPPSCVPPLTSFTAVALSHSQIPAESWSLVKLLYIFGWSSWEQVPPHPEGRRPLSLPFGWSELDDIITVHRWREPHYFLGRGDHWGSAHCPPLAAALRVTGSGEGGGQASPLDLRL